jgi:hypothetical protein
MNYHDIHSNYLPAYDVAPSVVTDNTAQTGQIHDMKGYDGIEWFILTGTLADADATFTVLIQHGDAANLSDAANVADADLIGTESDAGFTFAEDNSVRAIGYKGNKRYVRLTFTPVGNSGNAPLASMALKHALSLPVTQNA